MDTLVKHVTLKSGELAELRRVEMPDAPRRDALVRFYMHKGEPWVWQISCALGGCAKGLEALFFVAEIQGSLVGALAIEKAAWAGILSHVFVDPQHRRKGIASHLLEIAIEEFRCRAGRLLTLSTGYDSPAYHIYSQFGFASIVERSGIMMISNVENDHETYDPARPVKVTQATWRHWPLAAALFARVDGRCVRNVAYGVFGPGGLEGPFLYALKASMEGKGQMVVLESDSAPEAVVGLATLLPDSRWPHSVWLLDLFTHRDFENRAKDLIDGLDLSSRKIQCHVDADAAPLVGALRSSNFRVEGTMKAQVIHQDRPLDVLVMGRVVA